MLPCCPEGIISCNRRTALNSMKGGVGDRQAGSHLRSRPPAASKIQGPCDARSHGSVGGTRRGDRFPSIPSEGRPTTAAADGSQYRRSSIARGKRAVGDARRVERVSLVGSGSGPATAESASEMSALTWSEIVRTVEERAAGRCEYCRMHQDLQGATSHVEYIHPTSKGGTSGLENRAWACPGCNLAKSDRIEVPDPDTSADVSLFHPRRDWSTHFRWEDHRLIGRTPTGRATIFALDLNHARRIRIRQAQQLFGWFPP